MKMRLFFLFLLLGGSLMFLTAQTKYEVTANTFLNIRSSASVDAPVVGTIDRGGEVDVYSIENGRAKIAYDDGYSYVNSDYLRPVKSTSLHVEKTTTKWFEGLDLSNWKTHWDARVLVYVIAGLSALLWLIRLMRGNDLLDGVWLVINCILFSIIMGFELIYTFLIGGEATWFCNPEKVGWLWMVVNFIAFALLIYNQFLSFVNILEDMAYDSGGGFELKWGFNSLKWGVPIGILCAIVFSPEVAEVVLTVVLICQFVQVIKIYMGVVPYGGWWYSTAISLVYLLGIFATSILLIHFIVMLIIVVVALILLQMFAKSSSNSRRCCSNCYHYSYGYCKLHGHSISDASGTVCDRYD